MTNCKWLADLRKDSLQFLCCPACHGELLLSTEEVKDHEIVAGLLECQTCKRGYRIRDGISDFLLLDHLDAQDKRWMQEYDRMARNYDLIMCYLLPVFSLGLESLERRRWVRRLQIQREELVLDISTGTGRNVPFILNELGSQGSLLGMDISKGVLYYAKRKVGGKRNVEFQRANTAYLPYKTGVFDAVIHVGGVNTFGQKKRALHEMVRVAKPKGKIVIVDEGLAPGKENSFAGRFLLRLNKLYSCKPPTRLLPRETRNLQVAWKILPLLGFLPFWPHYIMDLQKAL